MSNRLFTDRIGGVSEGRYESLNLATHVGDEISNVIRNRQIVAARSITSVYMNQVHGNTVALIESHLPISPYADAMVTTEKGVALSVLVADCIPVLLWDEDATCVAVAHVGRRGLMNEVALKTIQVMREIGAHNIKAEFGPSICGKCYEVGEDVFKEVISAYPSARGHADSFEHALDLPAALEAELIRQNIVVSRSSVCTFESSNHFSYRRDGVTGRTAGVIWL